MVLAVLAVLALTGTYWHLLALIGTALHCTAALAQAQALATAQLALAGPLGRTDSEAAVQGLSGLSAWSVWPVWAAFLGPGFRRSSWG